MITINNIQIIINNIKDLLNIEDKHMLNHEQIFDVRADCLEQLDAADFNIICSFIRKCVNLKSIYLPNINVKNLDKTLQLPLLCNSVSTCVKLESLNLTGLNIETIALEQLEQISGSIGSLQKLQSLTFAWISLHNLTVQNMKIVFNTIRTLPVLQILNLEGIGLDEIDDERFQIVYDIICKCPSLKNIELYQIELDYMGSDRFDKLCDAINKSPSLMYCTFKSKQNDMIEERNKTIEKILQKKQISDLSKFRAISYFFSTQKSQSQICRKRKREDENLVAYRCKLKTTSPDSFCTPTL